MFAAACVLVSLAAVVDVGVAGAADYCACCLQPPAQATAESRTSVLAWFACGVVHKVGWVGVRSLLTMLPTALRCLLMILRGWCCWRYGNMFCFCDRVMHCAYLKERRRTSFVVV